MKFKGPVFFSILMLVVLLAAYFPKVDNAQKEAVLIHTILNGLKQLHYQPQVIDNEFSEKVYDLYLDRLDSGHRFLTQKDVKQLEAYKDLLDDEANKGTYEFFDLSLELLEKGLNKTQGYYRDILSQDLDYSNVESIELDGEKRPFAKNDKELRDYWRKYMEYEILMRLDKKLDEQEKSGEEAEEKSFEELEKEVRKDILKVLDDWYDRMHKLKRVDRLSFYLNTITNIFDPHTDYLKPIDKQNFNIRFSGRLEGIGARLQTDGDYTKVVQIVVGGPAWKQKELEENDVILKVTQGDNEAVDITGMQIDDVVQLVRGDKGTIVRLTVKKVDGTVTLISITRDIVIIDERFAKSLILDGGDEKEKLGYIYLPSFYADFENRDGHFCSKDVAAEIEKLTAENVAGIILDLRNNGGGSLRDVVKMSGYFIEDGPIVQVKSRGKKPEVLMDVDPRVQYRGPLVIMVNSFSASASEIMAAALQDYGRAIIVGSNSTFGKGTVQRFINLDRTIRGYDDIKPLGEVKMTVQKFYRVNGGSTQLKGVRPDVILPDSYQYIKTGEKQQKYPMKWSEINPVKYGQKVVKLDNRDEIKARSAARVAKNPTFQKVIENAARLEKQGDFSYFPLQLEAYRSLENKRENEAARFKDIFKETVNNGVINLEVDLPSIHADESKEARNQDFIKSVSKDIYIKETINILHDLIVLN